MSLIRELNRRNVFRVAAAYLVVAWLLLQVVDVVGPILGLPGWLPRAVLIALAVGFPVVVIVAWAFEFTPEGIKRESEVDRNVSITHQTGKRLNRVIIGALLLVIVLLVVERSMFATRDMQAPMEAVNSVAVLPFVNLSSDTEQQYFADGLTEEILNSLAQLPELLVTARTSSFYFKDKDVPVDEVANRLGVANILEGSVRRSGDDIRITAQLIRASDGFHIWSQSYDAAVDDVFQVQRDIAEKVATALDILLDDTKRGLMEDAGVRSPEAFTLFAKGFDRYSKAHGELPQIPSLAEARVYFEQATELAPEMWAAYFTSADLQSHILLRQATGLEVTGIDQRLVDSALVEHARLNRLAARVAPNESARDFVELSSRLFSDDWTGLGALGRKVLDHRQACGYDQWVHLPNAPFGSAMGAFEFFRRATLCNTVDTSAWAFAGSSAIYAGKPELALQVLDEGSLKAPASNAMHEFRVFALIALGRFRDARASLSNFDQDGVSGLTAAAAIAAAEGNAGVLAELRKNIDIVDDERVFYPMQMAAWAGDVEAANEVAAAIDARPAGSIALLALIHFCFCGAPFDIEATPIFKTRLEEAGIEWPPVSPIDFPLKDW